jgi:hypothetical protein
MHPSCGMSPHFLLVRRRVAFATLFRPPYPISYFPSCNSMPNMSASSTVILMRYWVISGRIRPFQYSSTCPHHHLSIPLVLAPATIICGADFLSFALRLRLTFSYPTSVCKESRASVFRLVVYYLIYSMLRGYLENERLHFLRTVHGCRYEF